MAKKKKTGEIYTPTPVIEKMCDTMFDLDPLFSYESLVRNHKHIMDNSCGTGNMLVCILNRVFQEHRFHRTPREDADLKWWLENCVHGIETNEESCKKCVSWLNQLVSWHFDEGRYKFGPIVWDIRNCDALSCHDYDGKIDYLIGNPPYVRVHDITLDSIKDYKFTQGGMTDLYLAFYELGFRMLNENGHMVYISPSSWFTSVAGRPLREYILENKNLVSVYDYGHRQIFENVTAYVAICHFIKDSFTRRIEFSTSGWHRSFDYDDVTINGKFYFASPETIDLLKNITNWQCPDCEKEFIVKNGFATLADNVFIYTPKDGRNIGRHLRGVIKSSTGEHKYIIYPYNAYGKLVPEDELSQQSPEVYRWLSENREKLESRATTEHWYAFGRTQAINDTYKWKLPVSSLISPQTKPKITIATEGTGVYGGLYILPVDGQDGDIRKQMEIFQWVKEKLWSTDFLLYVKALRKYKSGGYYTFSSKDLENYLNYNMNNN